MRSPADMKVIQIEITNACPHSCSNCTRFCGHHKRPFFMDWTTFERAVDSLRGYDGIIGLMGGEPLLHPEFERMTLYLRHCHPMETPLPLTHWPLRDFIRTTLARQSANMVLSRCKGPGLWTSMPRQYARHFELIQDSFVFQNLNDHCNPSYHQPLLIARRDLGIPDEEWLQLRDDCWIQNCWSASISPKGAFFCEVAAALDMLFDGPGGWAIEPDWWRRTPADFADQLHWCELCGAALQTIRRDANDEIDDVSPTLLDRLHQLHSPRPRAKRIAPYPPPASEKVNDRPGHVADSGQNIPWADLKPDQYIPEPSQRLGASNTNLLPRSVNALVFTHPAHTLADLEPTLVSALAELDQVYMLRCHPWAKWEHAQPPKKHSDQLSGQLTAQLTDQALAASDIVQSAIDKGRFHVLPGDDGQNPGLGLARALGTLPRRDWLFLLVPGQTLAHGMRDVLRQTFLNTGIVHLIPLPWAGSSPHSAQSPSHCSGMLLHPRAQALREAGFDRLAGCNDFDQIRSLWPRRKQVAGPLPDSGSTFVMELEYLRAVDQHLLFSTDSRDTAFRERFALVMSQAAPEKGPVLITQSAPVALTRSLVALLTTFNYQPHVLTQQRFVPFFRDVVPEERIWDFEHSETINFKALSDLRQAIKATVSFRGSIVPCGITRDLLEPGDGYQDVERTAMDLAGRIICRINLKRRFVR